MRSSHVTLSIAMLLGFAMMLVGCGKSPLPASKAPTSIAPLATVLQPGDTVELKFYYNKELNEQQVIRPDGKITLQYVGEIQAAGLTPTDLGAQLDKVYAQYVKNPGVAVFIRSSYSRRVIVAGEVRKAGVIEMPANLSVVEAIMLAGGVDLTTGDSGQVIIMRKDATTGKRQGYALSLNDTMTGGDVSNFMLEPQDIVYVPRTTIVNVNQFVDQYIGGVIPGGLIYSHSLGDGNIGIDSSNTRSTR